jgi:cyclase
MLKPKRIYFFLTLFTFITFMHASANFEEVEIETIPVQKNVYMLMGAGGNIGVSSGPDGLVMIDDQFAPLSKKIKKALKDLNQGKLHFILNTHWHHDHTGSNINFGKEAPIIAHANVRRRMEKGQVIEFLKKKIDPASPEALPVLTFDQSISLYFNGEEIKVIHYPSGHTDGDSVIYFTESNVIHMGDHFFKGRFPFIDLSSGGDVAGLAKNVKAVLDWAPKNAKIIPGHGELASRKDLQAFYEMILESMEIVINEIQSGKSLSEIQTEGLPAKYGPWGQGFISQDKWLELVYLSLTKNSLNRSKLK